MFRNREEIRKMLLDVVEKFRQKGAISPEKAMSIQELGLPPRFEEAMHRRLGQTGIFVEVNGKYYLNEDRLKQLQEQRRAGAGSSGGGGGWSSRRTLMALRLARFGTTLLLVILLALNFFVQSWELRIVSILFFAVWIALFVANFYYRSKLRRGSSAFRTVVS